MPLRIIRTPIPRVETLDTRQLTMPGVDRRRIERRPRARGCGQRMFRFPTRCNPAQGVMEIVSQHVEIRLGGERTSGDQIKARGEVYFTQKRSKTPTNPVTNDSAANVLTDSKSDPNPAGVVPENRRLSTHSASRTCAR